MSEDPGNAESRQGRGGVLTPPLAGVRVLELTTQLSGPFGAMVLADLGADVIKVESPQRPDAARTVPSTRIGGETTYYLSLNRNKRSVLLDVKDPDGYDAFLRLVDHVDVVLDNYRPDVMSRLKIDHEHLAARNPAIITCSVTGFGETGPDRDRPGYDYLMQALAGTMSLTGDPDGPPTKYGISVVDHVGGLFAAASICAALLGRDRDPQRRGRHIDLALLDTHLTMLSYLACEWLNGGEVPQRQRMSAHPRMVPSQLFETADSYIVVMPLAEHFFPALCDTIEMPELARDERFIDAEGRLRNRTEVLELLEERFAQRKSHEWLEALAKHRVPAAPVQTVPEALQMEQVRARDMVVELEHPVYGSYRAVGNPVKMSDTDSQPLVAAPPAGQDTRDILRALAGLSAAKVDELHERGVC